MPMNEKMKRIPRMLCALLLMGCAADDHDAMPDDPMRVLKTSADFPVPDRAMAERSGTSLAQLRRGHEVFVSTCFECHEPRIPVDPGEPDWHPIMRGMSWNAGLEPADEAALIDYARGAAGG